LGFPKAQHVLQHVKLARDLADGPEGGIGFGRLGPFGIVGKLIAHGSGPALWRSGALRVALADTRLQKLRGPEDENLARQYGHFLACLRITSDALSFLTHRETTERRNFHCLAAQK